MSHAVAPAPKRDTRSARPPLSEGTKAERRLALLLCGPAVLTMITVAGWPIVYSVWLSLQRFDLRFPDAREFVGLDNYSAVLSDRYWWTAFGVTLLITVVSVAVELVLGMTLALIMHWTLVGRGLVRTVSLVPYGIVTVVAAYSWFFAWSQDSGFLAGAFGPGAAPLTEWGAAVFAIIVAEVWKSTPFMALLLMAGVTLVSDDLLRAAAMDGATAWQRFKWVMIPAMKPAILVALLFRTLDTFRIFDTIFVLTAGLGDTASVSMLTYRNLFTGLNLGIASTMSVLIFLVAALIAFAFAKLFGTSAPGSEDRGNP